MNLTAKVEVETSEIESLFINAFEGGSAYWAAVPSLNKAQRELTKDVQCTSEKWFSYIMNHKGTMDVFDTEEVGWAQENSEPVFTPDQKIGSVTKASIKKALETMIEKYEEHYSDFKNGNDDAITADVFLQLAAMNDITYG